MEYTDTFANQHKKVECVDICLGKRDKGKHKANSLMGHYTNLSYVFFKL